MNEVNEMYNLDVEFHRCPILFTFFSLQFQKKWFWPWRSEDVSSVLYYPSIFIFWLSEDEMFASWTCPLNLSWMRSESISFFQQWIGMLLHLLDPRYPPKHTKIRVRGCSRHIILHVPSHYYNHDTSCRARQRSCGAKSSTMILQVLQVQLEIVSIA